MTMKTISKKLPGVKVLASIKAGGFAAGGNGGSNHSRRLLLLSVKSGIKAGSAGIAHSNHNRRLA
jgi:hypothetical protein